MKRKSINRWIIRCFLIILLLSMIASNIANLYEIRANTIQHEKELAEICAGNVTTSLNYLWKDSDENEADEELRTDVRRVLEILCGTYGLDHIYVYGMDAQTPSRHVYFFASSDARRDASRQPEGEQSALPLAGITDQERALLDGALEIQQSLQRPPAAKCIPGPRPIWTVTGYCARSLA